MNILTYSFLLPSFFVPSHGSLCSDSLAHCLTSVSVILEIRSPCHVEIPLGQETNEQMWNTNDAGSMIIYEIYQNLTNTTVNFTLMICRYIV